MPTKKQPRKTLHHAATGRFVSKKFNAAHKDRVVAVTGKKGKLPVTVQDIEISKSLATIVKELGKITGRSIELKYLPKINGK